MKIGAQLWLFNEVQDESVMDLTLSQLCSAGYSCVETMFGKPPYHRAILDRIGMSCYATHVALATVNDGSAVIEYCQRMGANVVCISGLLQWNERSANDYRRSASALNSLGRHLLAEGLSLQYHNHDFEFENVDGLTTGMDLLLSDLDPDVVTLCFDAGWVSKAGYDAVAFMLQHKERMGTVHMRDFKDSTSVPLGEGDLDLKSMVEVLPNLPTVQAVMVEQDPGTVDPVGDMRQSLIYLGDTFRVAF